MSLTTQYSPHGYKPLPSVPENSITPSMSSSLPTSQPESEQETSSVPQQAICVAIPRPRRATLVEFRARRKQKIHFSDNRVATTMALGNQNETETPDDSTVSTPQGQNVDFSWLQMPFTTGEDEPASTSEHSEYKIARPTSSLTTKSSRKVKMGSMMRKARNLMKIKKRGSEPNFIMMDPKARQSTLTVQQNNDTEQQTPQNEPVSTPQSQAANYVLALREMAITVEDPEHRHTILDAAAVLSDTIVDIKQAELKVLTSEAGARHAKQMRTVIDGAFNMSFSLGKALLAGHPVFYYRRRQTGEDEGDGK